MTYQIKHPVMTAGAGILWRLLKGNKGNKNQFLGIPPGQGASKTLPAAPAAGDWRPGPHRGLACPPAGGASMASRTAGYPPPPKHPAGLLGAYPGCSRSQPPGAGRQSRGRFGSLQEAAIWLAHEYPNAARSRQAAAQHRDTRCTPLRLLACLRILALGLPTA